MTPSTQIAPGRSSSVALVALFVAFAGVVVARETGQIDGILAKRGVGALLGGIMVVTGNILPKLIFPLSRAARVSAAERLCGWILVLTGLTLVAAFALLPDEGVTFWGAVIGLVGFVGVGLTLLGSDGAAVRDGIADSAEPTDTGTLACRSAKVRVSAIFILHAVAWAFAMFVADGLFGDRAAVWMVVAFTIANTLLAIKFRKQWFPVR
jgi:hypothetical protein